MGRKDNLKATHIPSCQPNKAQYQSGFLLMGCLPRTNQENVRMILRMIFEGTMLTETPPKASPESDAMVTGSLSEGVTTEVSKPTIPTKIRKVEKSTFRGISSTQLAKKTVRTRGKLHVKKREQKAELKEC